MHKRYSQKKSVVNQGRETHTHTHTSQKTIEICESKEIL